MTPTNPCELKPERLLIISTPVAEMSGWSYPNLFCWHKSHSLSFLVSTQLVMKKGLLGNKAAITKAFYLTRTSLKDNNSNSQLCSRAGWLRNNVSNINKTSIKDVCYTNIYIYRTQVCVRLRQMYSLLHVCLQYTVCYHGLGTTWISV